MSEITNTITDNTEIELRKSTVEAKVEFVKNIISQSEVPNDIKRKFCDYEKIFYQLKDQKRNKREWVSFFNNKFFCVYCLCFSTLNNNRLVEGVVYEKGCRITDKLQRHGNEKNHVLAKNTYSKKAADFENQEVVYRSAKRNAIQCIVKIIIFIATHGQYYNIAIFEIKITESK